MTSKMWVWLGGFEPAFYGILGVSSSKNNPGERESHTMCYDPSTHSLLVFGGRDVTSTTNSFNDLWSLSLCSSTWPREFCFSPPLNLSPPLDSFQSNFPDTRTQLTDSTRSSGFHSTPTCTDSTSALLKQSTLLKTSSFTTHDPKSGIIIRRVTNIWIDSLPIALTIIVAVLLVLSQVGFLSGYIYEERRTKRRNVNDTDHSLSTTNSSRMGPDASSSKNSYSGNSSSKSTNPTSSASTYPSSHARTNTSDSTNSPSEISSLAIPSESFVTTQRPRKIQQPGNYQTPQVRFA